MHLFRKLAFWPSALAVGLLTLAPVFSAVPPKKPHAVVLGSAKQVPYSKTGDPAGAGPDETTLRIRALLVDGRVSEWTTGDAHDVTDRSFVVRRALRINDNLPSDRPPDKPADAKQATGPQPALTSAHWVWQRGPWLLVDRLTGHVTALKLPDYDPGASQVAWFRDYAAYCGVTAAGKSLYAVVAQLGVRKPVLAKKLSAYDAGNHPWPICDLPEWQREPLKITFHPSGQEAAGFDLVGGSAALVEENDNSEAPAKP
ncbi:hypothetical protein [Acidicapsa acidisoli]|uniref:hypothetical protein n=1 Tax=Acidicapsa acidisoli TaxID=1615681 RepID=UPI0021DF825C|nr:hypothetical protein [Acidicapsa acidisoli]